MDIDTNDEKAFLVFDVWSRRVHMDCHIDFTREQLKALRDAIDKELGLRFCQSDKCMNAARALHPCPFREEIHGDETTLCNCCINCQLNCSDEI